MSSLIVEVSRVAEILPHPNADRLELARVKGWQVCIQKGAYQPNQLCVYVPPDSVLPAELAERWKITNYCSPIDKGAGGYKVKACRLRGERSFGTIQPVDSPEWTEGLDVAATLGITKFEPPVKFIAGDQAPDLPNFHKYTDIESYANFPNLIADDEEIVIEEKLHGSTLRCGLILVEDKYEIVCGSHNCRLKQIDDKGKESFYWMAAKHEGVLALLGDLSGGSRDIILFGELLGTQDMKYGLTEHSFRIFDISRDGIYLDSNEKYGILDHYGVLRTYPLYQGPFSREIVERFTDGPTTYCPPDIIKEKFKGREGIVIRPKVERYDYNVGRVILKSVSVDYLERKNANRTEDH